MNIYTLDNGLSVFKALSSEIRTAVFSLILDNPGLNVKHIAQTLDLPITTLSSHLQVLKDCNLVRTVDVPADRGTQKCCFPADTRPEQIMINLTPHGQESQLYSSEISIGQYADFDVSPTCGLASSTSLVGLVDEPRYFAHQNRYHANIVWFNTGYLEYILPVFIPANSRIDEISLSFEICSECAKTNNDWPSDISFSLNGTHLGTWVSPGDYGDRRGKLNPEWWYTFLNQYGLLKTLTVNHEGTFMNDKKLSDVSTGQLLLTDQSVLKFRFSVFPDAEHPGGCTLFGVGFGDYNQNIRISVRYSSLLTPRDI